MRFAYMYRCVTVANYTRGKVAAGLAVIVDLEVLARRHGTVREVVHVVAEDCSTEVIITGEVRPPLSDCSTVEPDSNQH